jgi:hypothetical protein
MGNLFSFFEENNETPLSTCPLCNKHVFKDKYIYSDLQCSQCKERLSEYYHPECWLSFSETCIKDRFICYKCSLFNVTQSNELP